MKVLLLLAVLVSSLQAMAFQPNQPIKVLPLVDVFMPLGFDNNDNAEIVVSGYLPDLCHKSLKTDYRVVGNTIYLDVDSYYYFRPGTECAEIIVPFLEKIDVGILNAGDYKVVVNKSASYTKSRNFRISRTNTVTVDSHIYANVEEIVPVEGTRKVKLKGINRSDCVVLDRIEWVDDGHNTYSILPIMTQVFKDCPSVEMPFEYEFEVPNKLITENILLHVRKMFGMSSNLFFKQ